MPFKKVLIISIVVFMSGLHSAQALEKNWDYNWSRIYSDPVELRADSKILREKKVHASGRYRLAAGFDDEAIFNESEPDSAERNNYRQFYGENLNNTFDPAIYQQVLVNVGAAPVETVRFFAQIVADPWSYTGTTGDQFQMDDEGFGFEDIRYNLKYFGANDSTINESFRTRSADLVYFPPIKITDGHTSRTIVQGLDSQSGISGDGIGNPYTIIEKNIDYQFQPIRKLWVDLGDDPVKVKIFALGDQSEALFTDDPLELSDHKAYWQWSPWIESYVPMQTFEVGNERPVKQAFYSNTYASQAKDSEGNRLVLLRGASVKINANDLDYAATIAAPLTPWDEKYFSPDNIPGAMRLKYQLNPRLMLGSTYTFRTGYVDGLQDSHNYVNALDFKYQYSDTTVLTGEFARSYDERNHVQIEKFHGNNVGQAYRAGVETAFEHDNDSSTDFKFHFTLMDRDFRPVLSNYLNTRDDQFWGQHISFDPISPEVGRFRIGDGIDRNRAVVRFQWTEKRYKDRFVNLFDVRNVHRAHNGAYKETVLRDEATVKINEQWTFKGLFRWHGMPTTTPNVEPFVSNYYFDTNQVEDASEITFFNNAIVADEDADRFTYSGALQYHANSKWTLEGIAEVSNNIPEFPRLLLVDYFRSSNDRVDGILFDRLAPFYYNQAGFKSTAPYSYFTIFKERVIFKPETNLRITGHFTQNSYRFAGTVDDNVNHQGVSAEFQYSKVLSFFADYTHSLMVDSPRFVSSLLTDQEYRGHHNVYVSMDYKLNKSNLFRAEYGVFGMGANTPLVSPYNVTSFSLPTVDTEHLLRLSLTGDF